eukprot:7664637-Pyramimonas_sp.AAC.1
MPVPDGGKVFIAVGKDRGEHRIVRVPRKYPDGRGEQQTQITCGVFRSEDLAVAGMEARVAKPMSPGEIKTKEQANIA